MKKEPNQDIHQVIQSVEDIPPIAADIVTNYCLVNDIDQKDIFPTIWNDILYELYEKLFENSNILKCENNLVKYDMNKVLYIYNKVYKKLCNKHNQEISLYGFELFSGIERQTIYTWKEPGKQVCDIHEKIFQDNEESLFALMRDRRINPMKILPKLNRVHGWNMQGVSRQATAQAVLLAHELPKLGNIPQIDSDTQDLE